jgi:FeS assembly SUF system regulator
MIRLSKITDYGILILAHMASARAREQGNASESLHTARELAEQVNLPLPVVSKILKSLAREGTLESQRGAKGGYSLRTDPGQITVAQMIEVLEGPVAMTECAVAAGICLHEGSCSVRDPWQLINRVIKDALGEITLADLTEGGAMNPRPLDRLIAFSQNASRDKEAGALRDV